MEATLPLLDAKIDEMIKNQERSSKRIESVLDTLLDYVGMGLGEEQFKRLNAYYGSFCAELSAEYDRYYDEIVQQ